MAGEVSRRLVGAVTLLVAAGSWLAIGGVASAKPAPKPTSIVITSKSMPDPLTLRADGNEDLFEAVLDQVDWLTGDGPATAPKAADLGMKFTVVVHVGDAAKKSYDLYPLAKGGPRAFRPAKQPDRTQPGAGWFFGRLTMGETLLAAGAPLPEQNITLHGGGVGGGERVIPDDAIGTGEDVNRLLGELRQLMLLNGAVLVSITLGLAGIALLVRRRTR
ncbi:hypothetical protein [Plantactinospora soyae]|uniref:Uncharacterized protein n=1 Tax=Plantactinospora soyae TaxID=1544732 RepID=A0A927RAS4_9ACTN|nr:hypothetical protein [Plantactinospora soyae]MBE1492644.1 hypothetical protein [Plantactinospora soyae]